MVLVRAFTKGVVRSVRGSLGRFLAILVIVALGCGFFAGLRMSGTDMRTAADAYYDDTALWDLRVMSTLGLDEKDLERLASTEGVGEVSGVTAVDAMVRIGAEQLAARVSTLPEEYAWGGEPAMDRLVLRSGHWPTSAGECVISADAPGLSAAIGDTLEVLYESGENDVLSVHELTVVGTVSSSNYPYTISFGTTTLGSGMLDQYLYVTADTFIEGTPYTEAHLSVVGAGDAVSGSEAYWDVVDEVKDRLEDASESLAESRLDDLRASAQEKLDESRSEYERERADALEQLEESRAELDAAQAQLDSAAEQVEQGSAQLSDSRAKYEEGLAAWEEARDEADGRLAEAQEQLDEAQAEIDSLEAPDIYVLDRSQSEGAATYQADSERMDAIATVFPFMLFLVAALVALTTMTRMVEDERGQIGTYKALGYSAPRIAGRYLAYAALASIAGAALGIAVLAQVLPVVVMYAYAIIYAVPQLPLPLPIDPVIALSSGGLGVGVTLVATLAAVGSALRETPAQLMQPRAPKAGRRILLERIRPLWRRLSFLRKVAARNLFRYKKRLFMTVIGISGCTAPLLVGFGLHDAIWDIIDNQFGPIIHYNTTVTLNEDAGEKDAGLVERLLGDCGAELLSRARILNVRVGSTGAEDSLSVQAVVPEDANAFDRTLSTRERLSQRDVPISDTGVLLAEKAAKKLGVSAGDTVVLYEQDAIGNAVGEGVELRVEGVVENYVGNIAYLGRGCWDELLGAGVVDEGEPRFSTLYVNVPEDASLRDELVEKLEGTGLVSTVVFTDETVEMYRDMLSSVDMIVVVLIVSAAALAAVVLYNLTNINIGERVREIATLKVLGFKRREVSAYIFREVLILTLIGDVLGLVLGTWLEGYVIVTAEVDVVMFGRVIHPASYVYAFVLTLVFSALVMLVMRRKLDRIDMVESLKSVD